MTSRTLAKYGVFLLAPLLGCAPGCGVPSRTGTDAGIDAASQLFWPETDFDFTFTESPRFEDEYSQGGFGRDIQITDREVGAYLHKGVWSSRLAYSSSKSTGLLVYRFAQPWVLGPAVEQARNWREYRGAIDCPGDPEDAFIGADRISTLDGGLIIYSAISVPTMPDGKIVLPPDLSPELSARWVPAGRPQAEWAPGVKAESMNLELTLASGTLVVATPGERTSFSIEGSQFEVAVFAVAVGGPGTCLAAKFIIYRSDVMTRLDAGSSTPG